MISLFIFSFFTSDGWGKCTYQVRSEDIQLQFTGYKFTSKKGVNGTFKKLKWAFSSKSASLQEALSSASVWIDLHSIDAGNIARNKNIIKGLFLTQGRYIRGLIHQVAPNARPSSAILKLFWGNSEMEIPLTILQRHKSLLLKGTLNLIQVGAAKAFKTLAKICRPLHRGKDGQPKTWPDVDLEVIIKYSQQCS